MIAIRILALCLAAIGASFGQVSSNVRWQFSAQTVSAYESVVVLHARVLPGWHLYSQYLPEGGPAPTRIQFTPHSNYQLKDSTREQGDAVTFYDHTYEMEITWYARSVTFTQRVLSEQRPLTVQGTIEYMTCNTEICQPSRQPFVVTINP